MTDRKYRQRGYQDEDRPTPSQKPQTGPKPESFGPRTPKLMGFRETIRCTRCGHMVSDAPASGARCGGCGVDLHSCIQCASFDPGSRFECMKTIPARIAPKDRDNTCPEFESKRTVEKETGSSGPPDARKAFDDLFKF